MLFFYYIIFLVLFGIIFRPITTLIHELGHGIPGLIYTNKKVTLYLGSYGDPNESFKISIGRLEVFFNKKLLNWKIGLCVLEQKELEINKQIIFCLMGPIASLILSFVLTYFIFFENFSDDIKIILFLFNISTYYDFFVNIIPSSNPIELYNGSTVYNDGKRIKELLILKKMPKEYNIGAKFYNNKEFDLAAISFEKAINSGFRKDFVYQILINSYIQIKDYEKASLYMKEFNQIFKGKFNSNDYSYSGLIKSHYGRHEEALKDYDKAIKMNPNNYYAINNRGYTYNLLEKYEKAIEDFNRAMTIETDFAYALNNRGFSKIKLGLKEDGLKDLEKSMTIDGTNSYCYLNFGIYYYENEQYIKALEYFNKAKELDGKTYMLDYYLDNVNIKLTI